MIALLPLLLSLELLGGTLGATHPNGPVCHPLDEEAAGVLRWVRGVASDPNEASGQQRALMHIQRVPYNRVRYVTDERICRSVLAEYNRYSSSRDATTGVETPPSQTVCVVAVGAAYVVTDPSKTYGEFLIHVTVDRQFRMLAHVLG